MRISDCSSDVCSSDLIRPGAVGGKALIWGRWSFRWSPEDFEANKRENVGIDWPIRYDDLAPWYDYVENYIGVSGSRENLPQLPDSAFQPPIQMNVAEKWVKERLEATSPGRKLINRTEEQTSEIQSLMRNSSAVFCLKK